MRLAKFVLFYTLYVAAGCGVDEARPKSLTDMQSVLLYQHVEGDRFRLLVCPYEVDLDIGHNCSNVFFTPEGDEYYFTGMPKQPWLFAPSQAAVKGLVTIPIVVGGAVLSWVVLRKLLMKFDVRATKKQLQGEIARVVKASDEGSKQAVRQLDELTPTSYRKLADDLERLNKKYKEKFKNKNIVDRSRSPRTEAERQATKKFADIWNDIEKDKKFMHKQFALIEKAIAESKIYQQLGFKGLRGKPQQPAAIFKKFRKTYDKEIAAMQKSLRGEGGLAFDEADTLIKNLQAMNDDLIESSDEFLSKLTQLMARDDLLTTVRANRRSFRGETATAAAEEIERRAKHIAQDASQQSARNLRDYVIAAFGGLLAGSYLPDQIPPLENYMFTEREWKKLFAPSDSFKKPLRVKDSYVVVKKLTRYLKGKGEQVVINEQMFSGLKN